MALLKNIFIVLVDKSIQLNPYAEIVLASAPIPTTGAYHLPSCASYGSFKDFSFPLSNISPVIITSFPDLIIIRLECPSILDFWTLLILLKL